MNGGLLILIKIPTFTSKKTQNESRNSPLYKQTKTVIGFALNYIQGY
jgi:hypothetical protein